MEDRRLQAVDREIEKRIDSYSDEFWASADRDPREDMHAYMQYPAMTVPEIQRELVKVVYESQAGIKNVLDPFVGAATTMTSCMSFGLDFTGQDINPLAVLVSRTKAGPFDEMMLEESKQRVFAAITADTLTGVEADFPNIDKWFQPHVKIGLSKIRRAIRAQDQLWVRRFFWVALAETVRLTSNSRTSTYKLHIRPADELKSRSLSAVEVFQEVVLQNLEDLKGFKCALQEHIDGNTYKGRLAIHLQDSSEEIFQPHGASQYDLLITSPPYGDNLSTVTYGQFSYLPLQWIDLADIDLKAAEGDWLRTTQEIDRRSLGGGTRVELEPAIMHLAERSPTYETTIEKLGDLPKDRPARVTSFLLDLDKTLAPIVEIMRPNAYLIWIVGNRHVGGEEIPTDKVLEELLKLRDVKLIKRFSRQILYRRMAARNQRAGMMRKEHILVFRKQGGS
jgi:site-specific DNA-methyltransferase (cytosine-N4-specific)